MGLLNPSYHHVPVLLVYLVPKYKPHLHLLKQLNAGNHKPLEQPFYLKACLQSQALHLNEYL
jgi:hypothetical protein